MKVTCDEGYSLTGPRDVTCNDGNWEPFIGQCLSHCPHPTVPNSNFAEAHTNRTVPHGEYVVVECDFGYSPGSVTNLPVPLTCDDGSWDSTVTCTESEECFPAPEVLGGGTPSFSPDATCYPLFAKVDIGCSGVLFGSSSAFYYGSTWSYGRISSSPTCEESSCNIPTPPEHGSEEYPGDQYTLYDVASFVCDDGYSLIGSREVMCTGTSQWEPDIPSCAENCIVPSVVNGNCNFTPGTSLRSGQTISISCADDFTLTGPDSATCRNGVWEPIIGECLRDCPAPTIANSNHEEDLGSIAHGDYVIVECDDGYTSGSDFPTPVTCYHGQWNFEVTCHEEIGSGSIAIYIVAVLVSVLTIVNVLLVSYCVAVKKRKLQASSSGTHLPPSSPYEDDTASSAPMNEEGASSGYSDLTLSDMSQSEYTSLQELDKTHQGPYDNVGIDKEYLELDVHHDYETIEATFPKTTF
ncbi:C4b-binding protein alpha chain-like [Diadema setosum]|uniref:C4b-binding protein alpha chain-like n=1 Tax=Diadema setosum TaxID=31175 RepID=UPI003B3B1502